MVCLKHELSFAVSLIFFTCLPRFITDNDKISVVIIDRTAEVDTIFKSASFFIYFLSLWVKERGKRSYLSPFTVY